MDTNGRRELPFTEQEAIEATEARIREHINRLWDEVSPDEKREVEQGLKEARERHDRSGFREVIRHQTEWSRRYFEEFDALLWEKDRKQIRPESYLALRKLLDTLRTRRLDKHFDEQTEEYNRALSEIEYRGEVTADHRRFPWIAEGGALDFVFTQEDVPYLRRRSIEAQKEAAQRTARVVALERVLGEYELHGEPARNPWGSIEDWFEMPTTQAAALEGRGLDYFTAVLELIGQPFESPTAYAKAIADLAPKQDGDPPEYTAVFSWLGDNGLRKPGQGLDDFRPQLEQEARRVLGFLHGNGQAGKLPRVRP